VTLKTMKLMSLKRALMAIYRSLLFGLSPRKGYRNARIPCVERMRSRKKYWNRALGRL
jgi:hypothetical protein